MDEALEEILKAISDQIRSMVLGQPLCKGLEAHSTAFSMQY
jgi:hypothetical protein